jgi:hypothetical protein
MISRKTLILCRDLAAQGSRHDWSVTEQRSTSQHSEVSLQCSCARQNGGSGFKGVFARTMKTLLSRDTK